MKGLRLLKLLPVIAALCGCYSRTFAVDLTPARAQLTLPGKNIYPESLTSTSDGSVFIGSLGARAIFKIKPSESAAEIWVSPDGDVSLGVFGVLADESRHTLWACFGAVPHDARMPQTPSILAAFDLQTGALKTRYPLPTPNALCNDVAVGSDGSVYATDSRNMEIVRLKSGAKQLDVWAGAGSYGYEDGVMARISQKVKNWAGYGGFGFKGDVLDGIAVVGNRIYVNTFGSGKLFKVSITEDGSAGAISEVKLERRLQGPDGMRNLGTDSLLLVEGRGATLLRAQLAGGSATLTTLKENFTDGPVAVTLIGSTAYVLEGQLQGLFDPKSAPAQKPFRATAVSIGGH